ncbi:hypothetical protein [Nocardia sp. CDC160]|uniref:hypothetical protein n=1 Tax=Nocardia sp. CDC160 TaxID=3112166 RepID=UPI002DC04CBD|nr:hypothetical protein [Nocardia sp. CDC160]MEC3920679.1 hypothetical protein [Nocardia sp. CDC160]
MSFTLGRSDSFPTPTPQAGEHDDDEIAELEAELVREAGVVGPSGWHSVEVVFTVTVEHCVGRCVYLVGERPLQVDASETMRAVVRRLRRLSPQRHREPWWGLRLRLDEQGHYEIIYDFGEQPPAELPSPEAYRDDLREFPRTRLPVWLAAYIGHGDRQSRSPGQAAAQARADRVAQRWPELVENELPDFPVMWARWAVIAAVYSAVQSDRGPRLLPAFAWFENSRHSGSTLYALPGGRAVLSGGVWNAPALDAAYNDGVAFPEYYAGAPDWIADPVLNPRARVGLQSFCYWWDAGRWYRGESPTAEQCAEAIPGVWTVGATAGIVTSVIGSHDDGGVLDAAVALVRLAETGEVTREAVAEVIGGLDSGDIDSALYQFELAGLHAPTVDPILADDAISRVHEYVVDHGYDTTGYPLDQLRADRISCGWVVYVPVPSGEHALGRATFYIADDGVIEQSTSSVRPASYTSGFAQRYRQRRRLPV